MRFTFAIPIAIAAVATALPQNPGGSRAILGWCATGVPGCGYSSLWDCSSRGGNSYSYCTTKCRCENKREPKVTPTNPSNPSKKPTLPPSEQLPFVKSEDKTSDSSGDPTQDEYTTPETETGEGETPDDQDFTYETTGLTDEGQDTPDSSDEFTAENEGDAESSEDTYYDDDSQPESTEGTESPEDTSSYEDEGLGV